MQGYTLEDSIFVISTSFFFVTTITSEVTGCVEHLQMTLSIEVFY